MATVTGVTAEKAQEIQDASIVSGEVIDGHLYLTTFGGTTSDAGAVLPNPVDVVVGETETQTLENKTLESPVITGIGSVQDVLKTGDESLNTNVTLQNDDHLLFNVVAGAKYTFVGTLFVSAGAGGMDVALNGPTLTALKFAASTTEKTAYNSETTLTGSAVQISGYIQCSADGVVNLKWAQNVSNGADCTMHLGSFITVRRVA